MKTEGRSPYALAEDKRYRDFIIKSINETFKNPEDSKKFYTVQEILSMFRADYYHIDWFEKELRGLGYRTHLKEGPFKGTKIAKYKIELKHPFTGLIKIDE